MDAGPEDRNSKRESQPETWVRLPWGQGFNSLANKVASARRCLDEADATRTVLCLAEWNVSLLLVNRRSSVDGERMLEDAVCAGMKIIEERKREQSRKWVASSSSSYYYLSDGWNVTPDLLPGERASLHPNQKDRKGKWSLARDDARSKRIERKKKKQVEGQRKIRPEAFFRTPYALRKTNASTFSFFFARLFVLILNPPTRPGTDS